MTTASQTALLFPSGQTEPGLQGRAARAAPLSAAAGTPAEGLPAETRTAFLRSLVAYLGGAEGGQGAGREPPAGAKAPPFLSLASERDLDLRQLLPDGGEALPPELTREVLQRAADALGIEVQQLVRQLAQWSSGQGLPGGEDAGLTRALNAALGQASGREGAPEPAQPTARAEAPRVPVATETAGAPRGGETWLSGLTNGGSAGGEAGGDLHGQQTQSSALHAALQKALGQGERQGGFDLSQLQTQAAAHSSAEARPAEVMPGAPSMVTNSTGLSLERALSGGALNTPFNQQGWGEEVGQRVRWMAGNQLQAATLKLNPPQLGPIDVRISVQNDQMSIVFTAHHALVREALEESVPRLRELMGEKGFDSVDVDISDDTQQRDSHLADADGEAMPGGERDERDGAASAGTGVDADTFHQASHYVPARWGGVDFYA